MHTQTHKAHHVANHAIRSALVTAQKEKAEKEIRKHPERFEKDVLQRFCSDNNISVFGNKSYPRTFITAIQKFVKKATEMNVVSIAVPVAPKKKHAVRVPKVVKKNVARPQTAGSQKVASSEVKHAALNHAGNLVGKGKEGKYLLYRNKGNEIRAEVVITEEGRRRVKILLAIGSFEYLTKDNAHEKWYIPYPTLRSGKFDAPRWMGDKQRRWIVSAIRDLRGLHELFLKRMSKKRHHGGEKVGPKPKQFGGRKREG